MLLLTAELDNHVSFLKTDTLQHTQTQRVGKNKPLFIKFPTLPTENLVCWSYHDEDKEKAELNSTTNQDSSTASSLSPYDLFKKMKKALRGLFDLSSLRQVRTESVRGIESIIVQNLVSSISRSYT